MNHANHDVKQFGNKLYLISLSPPLPGFENFIGIWVYTGPPALLIDAGPATTSAALLKALESLGVRTLDYLLLTHVHVDHAGGIADLAEAFPQAQIVVHAGGMPHLTQPDRLWKASLKALGDTALGYGAIRAVPPERLRAAEALDDPRVQVIPTPGHSPHHLSYRVGDILFAGEAGGVCLPMENTQPYMRPATPPRFFLDVTLRSLKALMELNPQSIAYSHWGLFEDAPQLLRSHRNQLLLWERVIHQTLSEGGAGDPAERCLFRLIQSDGRLRAYATLPGPVKRRESMFLRNSIAGFIGYWLETAGGT